MSDQPTKKTLRQKLIVASVSLALSLAVAEVGVRIAVGSPLAERLPILEVQANPLRGWEMVPGETHYTYHHPVRVNALGLRGVEVAAKQPDELRVLALGDSLIYGQGVADKDTVPVQLQEALSTSDDFGRPWSVVNGGLRAYDTRQELALLDELGAAIDPDVVVLFWYRNDFEERDIESTHARLVESGRIAFDIGTPLEGWAAAKWHAKQLVRRSALVMFAHDCVAKDQVARVDDAMAEVGLERFDGYLERFVQTAAEKGFRPLLAVIPVPSLIATAEPERGPAPEVLAAAEQHGVTTVDLFDPLRNAFLAQGKLPTVPFDGHFNRAGNGAIASAVAELILEQLGDPQSAPE